MTRRESPSSRWRWRRCEPPRARTRRRWRRRAARGADASRTVAAEERASAAEARAERAERARGGGGGVRRRRLSRCGRSRRVDRGVGARSRGVHAGPTRGGCDSPGARSDGGDWRGRRIGGGGGGGACDGGGGASTRRRRRRRESRREIHGGGGDRRARARRTKGEPPRPREGEPRPNHQIVRGRGRRQGWRKGRRCRRGRGLGRDHSLRVGRRSLPLRRWRDTVGVDAAEDAGGCEARRDGIFASRRA